MAHYDEPISDLLLEITTRIPLQDLAKIRLVNKGWNILTYEPMFMFLHLQRAKFVQGYFIQGAVSCKHSSLFVPIHKPNENSDGFGLSLDFLPSTSSIKILACHEGILLCKKEFGDHKPNIPQYYVCKPTTKEWVKIPNPKTHFFASKISLAVMRRNPFHYKIVRVSSGKNKLHGYMIYTCEVFDSEYWKWKRLDDIRLPLDSCVFSNNEDSVTVSGIMYCLVSPCEHIFAFDLYKEEWRLIHLPDSLADDDSGFHKHKFLVNHRGNLGIVSTSNNTKAIGLWIMENGDIWRMEITMQTEATRKKDNDFHPLALYNSNIALMGRPNKVELYDFSNFTTKMVMKTNYLRVENKFFYNADFEPCNLGPKR